jgi:hypothetical protein
MVVNRHLPYEIILPKQSGDHFWAMQQWCFTHFGARWSPISRIPAEQHGRWTVLWDGPDNYKSYRWHFRTEQDAVVFTLRWA